MGMVTDPPSRTIVRMEGCYLMPVECLLQGMCSINGNDCSDDDICCDNNGNNYDDRNNRINTHSFGGRGAEGSFVFYKITLLPETGRVAPAGSCLISRLWSYGFLGPYAWSWLNELCWISPKAEPQERTWVQVVYVEGGPGNRSEGTGAEWQGKRKKQLKCILRSLASVYLWKAYRVSSRIVH